eukprot:5624786-Pyramimonas_sp.AAC.1
MQEGADPQFAGTTTSYSVEFTSGELAQRSTTFCTDNSSIIAYYDKRRKKTLPIRVRGDTPRDVREGQRLVPPLWVATLNVLKQKSGWSEEYKLGANGYRKDLNATSANEVWVLCHMKIDAKGVVEYVPNQSDLAEWGISEDEARNLIKAAEESASRPPSFL